MAQRDKVKELVGRGLNSYHTKSLQQMDRIEKKNKEQNHKISILSNELDNDYLTKTEEGSVVSLEHSKEGMIYLDELQGNTLVNYCTDGSKEMTLNGDIDVEGVSVTTTEGVDNGKVDVMCEGNTLVNLKLNSGNVCSVSCSGDKSTYVRIDESSPILLKGEILQTGQENNNTWQYFGFGKINMNLLKTNTTYTLIIKDEYKTTKGVYLQNGDTSHCFTVNSSVVSKYIDNYNYVVFKTKDDFTGLNPNYPILYGALPSTYVGKLDISIIGVFEGDLTNQEIPKEYFKGMKSVGQDDVNGHKIEILSQNKNLCTVNSYSGVCHNKIETNIPCKKNTIYTLTFKDESDLNQSGSRGITLITHKTKTDKKDHGSIYTYAMGEGGKEYTFRESGFTFNTSDCCYISLTSNNMSSVPNLIIKEIQIEEGSQTSYSPHMFNKKEILINEPLRSLPNGVKDKLVKIGNRWFVERNCGVVVANETKNYILDNVNLDTRSNISAYFRIDFQFTNGYRQLSNKILTSHFVEQQYDSLTGSIGDLVGIGTVKENDTTQRIIFSIPKTKLTSLDENGFISYFRQNPTKVIYQLKTPTYEPLEIEPVLNTYNDITHISNNSIIPCNMKIKNSGYNAIIKPNTLYTVALDTNKGGTVGMNLGGAKGTTTNNVLTLTTPATLTDDSLRLYGKGIKGSKVRLLEGDKTNWIPSYFEGMKSSFEDKVQDDGSYKMEILMNNENLLSVNLVASGTDRTETPHPIYFKKGHTYMFAIENCIVGNQIFLMKHSGYPYPTSLGSEGVIQIINDWSNPKDKFIFTAEQSGYFYIQTRGEDRDIILQNPKAIVSENINAVYVPQKSNKIQFSSIEPLRSVGDVKDRFVFKDGKLMIERNCVQSILDRTSSFDYVDNSTYSNSVVRFNYNNPLILKGESVNDDRILCNTLPSMKHSLSGSNKKSIRIHGTNDNIVLLYINKNELNSLDVNGLYEWLVQNPTEIIFASKEPTYEEIPFELQKIILEGYENGTLFIDTNIPPTVTTTYAGETPIVKATKLNKTEVLNNTEDINDNIIPYLMDMDYRVVMLQLATEELEGGVSMARLFGGAYEMLKRDILSKRLTREEYGYRLADYFNAGKLTEEQVRELEELR